MWIFDKLFNRKIEGQSSLDHLESLTPLEEEAENLKALSDKASVVGNKVIVDGDFEADGITSKGIANTGALANIGDVAVSGDLDASGDLTVKTIYQSQPNFSQDLDLSNLHNLPANCEVINVYSKLVQWNRELHLVFNFKIKNNGETQSSGFNSVNNYFSIPEEIAEKIIDFDGKSVAESSSQTICGGTYNAGSTTYPTSLDNLIKGFALTNTLTANMFRLSIGGISGIGAGQTLYISGRISLDLV